MKHACLTAVAAALLATGALAAIPALTPVEQNKDPNAWWLKRHAQKLEQAKKTPPEVVFVGDSIVHGWEGAGKEQWNRYFAGTPYHALNLGFGADRTEHVLWRIAHGELDGYKAKAVVLMIGTNNTGHRPFEKETPADTILGVKAVIDAIRAKQPQAKLILLPIFPRGANEQNGLRIRNNVVNRELFKFTDGRDVVWCDFTRQFLTPDGVLPAEIMPDLLHPGAYGYEIWAAGVMPLLNRALAGAPGPFPQRFQPFTDPKAYATARDDFPAFPETRLREAWWLDRLRVKRNAIQASNGAFDLVFFGDSITHFWETAGKNVLADIRKDYSVLDIGYSGDSTQHLVWRGLYGEMDGYKAKCVMLMIGTNNRDKAPAIAKGVRRVLDVIAQKQPQATTLLLPIFPRGADAQDAHRVRNEAVNAIIRGYADGKKVVWCDFNAKFLDAKGDTKALMNDRLHPNEAGYRVWRDAVMPSFKAICGK